MPVCVGWIFVLPALSAYAAFVLWPIIQAFRYSFYNWDGVAPAQWAGLQNFKTVFSNEQLIGVHRSRIRADPVFQRHPSTARA